MHTVNEKLWRAGKRLLASPPSGKRLLAAASLLHVALAVGLFWAGRAQIAPDLLDRDGIVASYAFDSYLYQREAARLSVILKDDGLREWVVADGRAHVKLISLQFALFEPLFGQTPLSAEPLNLFCYIAILILVFTLGHEVGGRRVGFVAAGIVALWPTFLLHTTQLLKDPLFIVGALALILIVTTWLTRTYSWRGAIGMGALMAFTTALLLLIRVQFGVVIYALVFFAFVLLIIRQLLERRLLYWNLICPLLILVAGAFATFYMAASHGPLTTQTPHTYTERLYAAAETTALEAGRVRYTFIAWHPEAGSIIDPHVEFKNFNDLILYLPRALAIGLWAPFPKDWVSVGMSVGRAGRLLAGAETFLIYLCQLLALVGILRAPRCLPAWLLLTITIFGVTALGLVVSNIGALYRFRYLFWVLLIILGAKGLESIVTALKAETSDSPARAGKPLYERA